MLLIDVGNSRIKWGFWQDNQVEGYSAFAYSEGDLQNLLIKELGHSVSQKVFICSVASEKINQLIIKWFESQWQINAELVLTQGKQFGVVNAYQNKNALGVDRWLGMLAAYHQNRKAVCVIDCGTAVTLDVVGKDGQHLGGLIMPGLNMMQKSLLVGTQGIGSLQGEISMLADNTEDAVIGGCAHLLVTGLDGLYKKHYQQLDGELICIVTGGDGEKVAKAMESNCHYEEDLILYGLHLVAQSRD
jgi:type III pantothenate kinase